jgi:hypothetical protein
MVSQNNIFEYSQTVWFWQQNKRMTAIHHQQNPTLVTYTGTSTSCTSDTVWGTRYQSVFIKRIDILCKHAVEKDQKMWERFVQYATKRSTSQTGSQTQYRASTVPTHTNSHTECGNMSPSPGHLVFCSHQRVNRNRGVMVITMVKIDQNMLQSNKQCTKQVEKTHDESTTSKARALLGLINHKNIVNTATNQKREEKNTRWKKI